MLPISYKCMFPFSYNIHKKRSASFTQYPVVERLVAVRKRSDAKMTLVIPEVISNRRRHSLPMEIHKLTEVTTMYSYFSGVLKRSSEKTLNQPSQKKNCTPIIYNPGTYYPRSQYCIVNWWAIVPYLSQVHVWLAETNTSPSHVVIAIWPLDIRHFIVCNPRKEIRTDLQNG